MQVKACYKALNKKHKTGKFAMMWAGLLINTPLLITMSFAVRNALASSPEMATSTALWLSTFGDPDGTGILPIATGILAYANIELIRRSQRITRALYADPSYEGSEIAAAASAEGSGPNADAAGFASGSTPAAVRTAPALPSASSHRPQVPPVERSPGKRGVSDVKHVWGEKSETRRTSSTVGKLPRSRIGPDGPEQRAQRGQRGQREQRGNKARGPTEAELETVTSGAVGDPANVDRVSKGITNFMTLFAIAMVPIGLNTPSVSTLLLGSADTQLIVAYWFASMLFTSLQTIAFSAYDGRKLRRLVADREAKAQASLEAQRLDRATLKP